MAVLTKGATGLIITVTSAKPTVQQNLQSSGIFAIADLCLTCMKDMTVELSLLFPGLGQGHAPGPALLYGLEAGETPVLI